MPPASHINKHKAVLEFLLAQKSNWEWEAYSEAPSHRDRIARHIFTLEENFNFLPSQNILVTQYLQTSGKGAQTKLIFSFLQFNF